MTKNNDNPTLEEWKKLYELAIKFEKIGAWDWMYDVDLFGVMDPETKIIGYCSVMGHNGEFYGFGIYPGAEGFESYSRVARGDVPEDDNEKIHVQRCLMMDYSTRDAITEEEMEIIKKTGARFRNRNFWPGFRDYSPGYCPWFITGEDARFLIVVVEQALETVLDFKEKKHEFMAHAPKKLIVKIPKEQNGKIDWYYEYLAPEKYIKNEIIPVLNEADEIIAHNIKKEIETNYELEWELDYFRAPEPVKNSDGLGRPFYPYMFFVVDHISGEVMSVELSNPSEARMSVFRKSLLKTIKKFNRLPATLLIRNPELAKIIKPVADILKIKIKMSNELEMFDEAKDSFTRDCC